MRAAAAGRVRANGKQRKYQGSSGDFEASLWCPSNNFPTDTRLNSSCILVESLLLESSQIASQGEPRQLGYHPSQTAGLRRPALDRMRLSRQSTCAAVCRHLLAHLGHKREPRQTVPRAKNRRRWGHCSPAGRLLA